VQEWVKDADALQKGKNGPGRGKGDWWLSKFRSLGPEKSRAVKTREGACNGWTSSLISSLPFLALVCEWANYLLTPSVLASLKDTP